MDDRGDAPATPFEPREFELVANPPGLATPLVMGVLLGLLVTHTLRSIGIQPVFAVVTGLAWALVSGTLAAAFAKRREPDRIRVLGDAVMLARGDKSVREVKLSRLVEVNELDTTNGPILLLADDRQTLAIVSAQLLSRPSYETLTQLLVEQMQVVDPTGELGRRAVRGGKLREVLAQQPIRATPVIAGVIALATSLSWAFLVPAVAGQPFPEESLGALSTPLLFRGESFRALSYIFVHASIEQLFVVLLGMLWLGGWLERIVGWERVLIAVFAGAIGGAVGLSFLGLPVPQLGAEPAVFGLLGLFIATATVGRRHLPRALHPRPALWVALGLLALLMLLLAIGAGDSAGQLPRLFATFVPELAMATNLGGLLVGFLVSAAMLIGLEMPASAEKRAELRPFAALAIVALAIGLVGGAAHGRRDHPDDAEIVFDAYTTLPPTLENALIQNGVAYTMVTQPAATSETVEFAGKLGEVAVRNSERKSPAILDTLAVARYKQGNPAEARNLLQEALKLDSPDALRVFLERRLHDVNAGGALTPDDVK